MAARFMGQNITIRSGQDYTITSDAPQENRENNNTIGINELNS